MQNSVSHTSIDSPKQFRTANGNSSARRKHSRAPSAERNSAFDNTGGCIVTGQRDRQRRLFVCKRFYYVNFMAEKIFCQARGRVCVCHESECKSSSVAECSGAGRAVSANNLNMCARHSFRPLRCVRFTRLSGRGRKKARVLHTQSLAARLSLGRKHKTACGGALDAFRRT